MRKHLPDEDVTDVVCVAISGGHLAQLRQLADRLTPEPRVTWVTDRTAQSESLLTGEFVTYVPTRAPRAWAGVLRDTLTVWKHLREHRPQLVLSTGSQIALSTNMACRIARVPFVYIESATRVEGLSTTGNLINRDRSVRKFAQYPSVADSNPSWAYAFSVFDGYQATPTPERLAQKIVVSVGGNNQYGFRRLVERVAQIAPPGSEVIWQVGPTHTSDLGIEAHVALPSSVLREQMLSADVVICHAGTGSILMALDSGQYPIVVPRRAEMNEHVDNHQSELANFVSASGLALSVDASQITSDDLSVAASYRVERLNSPPRIATSMLREARLEE